MFDLLIYVLGTIGICVVTGLVGAAWGLVIVKVLLR